VKFNLDMLYPGICFRLAFGIIRERFYAMSGYGKQQS